MSQRISASGQSLVACPSMRSKDSAVPCFRSRSTADFQRPILVGNTERAWACTARAVSTEPRVRHDCASSSHVRFRSSSSTPRQMELRTMEAQVSGAPAFSAASASLSHCSRSITTWSLVRTSTAFSMILPTISAWPWASSSLAAVIQMAGSDGIAPRAWFSTLRAFSYVSKRASASHMSTLWGTHSTALPSMILASPASSRVMACRQSLTLLGTNSSARRSTVFLRSNSLSSSAACIQILTLCGRWWMALARMVLAFSPDCSRAASSHTSSDSGHVSHPCLISARADTIFPANSSTLAAAIQPGPCLGLVEVTLLSRRRAFLMSPTSASLLILMLFRSVR
mmetsp:Transcript_41909/g.94687  ORF Transcript_41909/g.94687 Transcript_41909/m.94687 type:complete len:341 (-) Transcript_41909:969-1991(-)